MKREHRFHDRRHSDCGFCPTDAVLINPATNKTRKVNSLRSSHGIGNRHASSILNSAFVLLYYALQRVVPCSIEQLPTGKVVNFLMLLISRHHVDVEGVLSSRSPSICVGPKPCCLSLEHTIFFNRVCLCPPSLPCTATSLLINNIYSYTADQEHLTMQVVGYKP